MANQADSPVVHDPRNFTVDKSLAKEPASVIFISTANISGFEPETGGKAVLDRSINIDAVITGIERERLADSTRSTKSSVANLCGSNG